MEPYAFNTYPSLHLCMILLCSGQTRIQVQALEGLGQENARLVASNEAMAKQLSGSTSLSVHSSTEHPMQIIRAA